MLFHDRSGYLRLSGKVSLVQDTWDYVRFVQDFMLWQIRWG